jgi:hypothetical protein
MSNITLPNGYRMVTTFFEDFNIAEEFGIEGVRETFNNAFSSWKYNHIYLTELAIVMSNNSIARYETNRELSMVYAECYHKVDDYCMNNLKGSSLEFYMKTTD